MSWFAPMDLPSSPPSSSDGVDRSSVSGTGSVPSIPDGAAAPIDPQARSPAEITSVSCLGPLFATLFSRRQTAPDSAAGVAKAAKKAEKAAKAPKKRAYSGVGDFTDHFYEEKNPVKTSYDLPSYGSEQVYKCQRASQRHFREYIP